MSPLVIDASGFNVGGNLPPRLSGSKVELHFQAGNLIALIIRPNVNYIECCCNRSSPPHLASPLQKSECNLCKGWWLLRPSLPDINDASKSSGCYYSVIRLSLFCHSDLTTKCTLNIHPYFVVQIPYMLAISVFHGYTLCDCTSDIRPS